MTEEIKNRGVMTRLKEAIGKAFDPLGNEPFDFSEMGIPCGAGQKVEHKPK